MAEKETKQFNLKKAISISATVAVALILIAVTLFSIFGRSKNTRTHFDTVTGERITTDIPFGVENEFAKFYETLTEFEAFSYNDDFKAEYPVMAENFGDRNFCASDDVHSYTFEGGVLILDSYSYEPDYSVRFMDACFVPYEYSENRAIIIKAPVRVTFKYDTKVGTITGEEFDEENFRLSFYDLSLEISNFEKSERWTVTASAENGTDNVDLLKGIASNFEIYKGSEKISDKEAAGSYNAFVSAKTTDTSPITVTMNFNDFMYQNFKQATVSLVNEKDYPCDSLDFKIIVNK